MEQTSQNSEYKILIINETKTRSREKRAIDGNQLPAYSRCCIFSTVNESSNISKSIGTCKAREKVMHFKGLHSVQANKEQSNRILCRIKCATNKLNTNERRKRRETGKSGLFKPT